jgi:hypothetical protein
MASRRTQKALARRAKVLNKGLARETAVFFNRGFWGRLYFALFRR